MAPEMTSGGTIDARTDVYLLGSTLHLILTGRLRHPGSTLTEALEHARLSPPHAYGPEVPAELAALVNRACDLDPEQRPPTARAFRDAIKLFIKHRQAVALADQARTRVAELDALLTLPEHDDAQSAKVERLLAEARFGLEQSLAQWSENPAAQSSLQRVESIVDQRRRAVLALEAAERQRDPRRGMFGRTLGLMGMTLLASFVAFLANFTSLKPSPVTMVFFPTLMIVAVSALSWIFRASLLETSFNRRALAAVYVALGFVIAGRLVGFAKDVSIAEHFARDCFVLAATSGIFALSFLPWVGLLSAIWGLTGVLVMLQPDHALQIFSWSTVAAMGLGALVSWRGERRSLLS
jgi:hypothetical protein